MIEIFVASFFMVMVKGFQQKNVMGDYYLWVTPTSMLMAAAECVIILEVSQAATYWAIIPMGIGGGLGCLLGMFVHNKFVSNGDYN